MGQGRRGKRFICVQRTSMQAISYSQPRAPRGVQWVVGTRGTAEVLRS